MKSQRLPGVAEAGGLDEHKLNPKERVVHKLKQFLAIFLYLWVLLALFDLHRTIILAEHHLNYPAQGFAIVNALHGEGDFDRRGFAPREQVPG